MWQATRFIMISAALISFCSAFSQSFDNNWVFSDSIGLNFGTGEPVFFNTAIESAGEACASISDQEGNLLFYTNGVVVWDKTNTIMPNGEDLDIGYFTPEYGSNITQGVLIAPKPGSVDIFFIFYLSQNAGWDSGIGIKYSIVDMSLNGGLGDVTEKNILLNSDTLAEKLQLVKHGNGRDWWLISITKGNHEGDLTKFVKYIITPLGILGPYYQNYSDDYHDSNGSVQNVGYMKFSSSGNKACIAKDIDVDIYDFDRCTGEFTNYLNIDTVIPTGSSNALYAIEFSLNGRYFYVDSYGNYHGNVLYQFCLNCPEPVGETKKLIYKGDSITILMGLLRASNNKIYLSCSRPSVPGIDSNLYVINYPELEGLLCNLDTLSISLNGKSLSPWSNLPNMPNYSLGPLVGSECDTLLAVQNPKADKIKIYPNPTGDYINIVGPPGIYDAILYNLLGEKVFEQKNNSGPVKLNLALNNGVYELVISCDGQIAGVEKVTISR